MDTNLEHTPAETPATPAIETVEGAVASAPLPAIDRVRLPRRRLVPLWIPIASAALVVLVLAGVGLAAFVRSGSVIAVPNVVGADVDVATTQLKQSGLDLSVAEKRFSEKPAGTVLEQDPVAGTKLRRGGAVRVVVSAGTDQVTMPDVLNTPISVARPRIESLGLVIRLEVDSSDQPSDTVLSTWPSPGERIAIGSTVRVTISAGGSAVVALLPYRLQGVVVALDPAPVKAGKPDVPLEVARRLRSLLEAAGAQVVVSRSANDTATATADSARAKRLSTVHPTVAIGLAASDTGTPGLAVLASSSGSDTVATSSARLASEVATSLVSSELKAAVVSAPSDPVLTRILAPWARVRLGAFSSKTDAALFSDPDWADTVARAIYRAVGEIYGTR